MFIKKSTIFVVILMLCGIALKTQAQTTSVFSAGLSQPSKIILTPGGNLIVTETLGPPNSGRISIVNGSGARRTLVDGLPSGISIEGPSGPSGLDMRGRTLYVAIGEGDGTLAGPFPGTEVPNPNPSSPLLSSVLAIHFSANVEKTTNGFTLTMAEQAAMAGGNAVTLSNGSGDTITLSLLANFPNYVPNPIPPFPANVRHSNPFGLVSAGKFVYVSDGGMNNVVSVNTETGETQTVTTFPPRPNPLPFGPPFIEAVPAGIKIINGQLLTTLFTGFPFVPGLSEVRSVDVLNGTSSVLIGGRSSAIDVAEGKTRRGTTQYYVLELSTDLLANMPGQLLSFSSASAMPTVVAGGLISPSGMARDHVSGDIYITEIFTGRIMRVSGL